MNGNEAHGQGNSTNSVIDITVRGTECKGRNAEHVVDSLFGPAKFGDDLFIGQRGYTTHISDRNGILK